MVVPAGPAGKAAQEATPGRLCTPLPVLAGPVVLAGLVVPAASGSDLAAPEGPAVTGAQVGALTAAPPGDLEVTAALEETAVLAD